MTEDDKQGPDSAPGSGAGDAAPTQQIPRIPKPKTPAKAPAKGAAKRPAGSGTAKRSPAKKATPAQTTDKGRPRDTPPVAAKKAEPKPKDSGDDGRTLTAADYARTTRPSPSTTAVIPAVKDTDSGKPGTAAPAPSAASTEAGSGRRASLRLTRVEPWSVTRLAFAISVALMIVAVVAVTIFWVVLEATGVWDQINGSVTSVLSDDSSSFNITDYLGFGRLVGLTLVLSAINVVLMTALATIGAHLYNLAAQLLGGVEVTFSEER